MKRFLGFVKKEFLHIFRDFRTLIILFVGLIAGFAAFRTIFADYAARRKAEAAGA